MELRLPGEPKRKDNIKYPKLFQNNPKEFHRRLINLDNIVRTYHHPGNQFYMNRIEHDINKLKKILFEKKKN